MKGLNMEALREGKEVEESRIEVLRDRFLQMQRDGRAMEAVCAEGELVRSHGIWLSGGLLN